MVQFYFYIQIYGDVFILIFHCNTFRFTGLCIVKVGAAEMMTVFVDGKP